MEHNATIALFRSATIGELLAYERAQRLLADASRRGVSDERSVRLPLPPPLRLTHPVETVRRDPAGILAVRVGRQCADVGQRPLAPVSVLRRGRRKQDGTPFAAPAGRRKLRRRARLKQRAGCQDQREQQRQARG